MFQDPTEPNRIVVHLDFPSAAAAEAFRAEPTLPAMMERAGVLGEPGIGLARLGERKVYAAHRVRARRDGRRSSGHPFGGGPDGITHPMH